MDRLKILVVDDESRMRKLVKDFLVKRDFDVVEAEDGEQAIDIFYEDKSISLIILDVMMPKMNGYEAARYIRKIDNRMKADIPIIAMTANAFAEDVQAALNAGMDDHVAKPVDMSILTSVITKHIEG